MKDIVFSSPFPKEDGERVFIHSDRIVDPLVAEFLEEDDEEEEAYLDGLPGLIDEVVGEDDDEFFSPHPLVYAESGNVSAPPKDPTLLSASPANPIVSNPPIRRIHACYLGGEGKKGRKYFISGLVNGRLFHQALDSAADISIIPENIIKTLGLKKYHLDQPFTCEGFQSSASSSVQINYFCCVDVDLGGSVLPVKFYVAPTVGKFALLGTDVLGDPSSGFSFETSTGIVKYGGNIFYSKKATESSTVEFRRREKMGSKSYQRQNAAVNRSPKMRSSRKIVVGPRCVTWIDAHVSGGPVSKMHSFLSFYSEDEDLISIPNFTFHQSRHRYRLPVTNETSNSFTFPAGAVLGDVVQHVKDAAQDDEAPSIFHVVSGRDLLSTNLAGKEEEGKRG